MGHIAIVSAETLRTQLSSRCLRVGGKLGDMWEKTLADQLADLMALRPGDALFPWVVASREDGTGNEGFGHLFRIAGSPRFVATDDYPFHVDLEAEAIHWSPRLDEHDALELFTERPLWNLIGKKSLGRGRSITHQTPLEDEELIARLDAKWGSSKITDTRVRSPLPGVPLTISLKDGAASGSKPSRLQEVDFDRLHWVRDGHFRYEKALEAWLCANIDREGARSLLEILGLEPAGLHWFGNYLAFGVQGSSIDLVLLSHGDGERDVRCHCIELKRGVLSLAERAAAESQVGLYAPFLDRALRHFGRTVSMRRVILSGAPTVLQRAQRGTGRSDERALHVGYRVQNESTVVFERLS